MEENMSSLQPSTLSNDELIHYGTDLIEGRGLPIEWQRELMRRFIAAAPVHTIRITDAKQLDLFL
jgi:phage FluMu gp28-like protein